MNTRENPRMNITEFSITVRSRRLSDASRPSAPTPEISDTYPGTSGSTHGERNESKPARKAAMGNGRFAILVYCTRPERTMTQSPDGPIYFLSPVQPSATTIESPGLCGSYFTEVARPRRQE